MSIFERYLTLLHSLILIWFSKDISSPVFNRKAEEICFRVSNKDQLWRGHNSGVEIQKNTELVYSKWSYMNILIRTSFQNTFREVLEEQITPVIFDIEEHAEDDGEVHEADEDDHHHA